MNENKTNINWYPGHMAKTKREIKEKIDLIDVVFEVIDARIPKASKNNDMDDIIKSKPRILIMSKADLCDMDKSLVWKKYYEKRGYKVAMVDLVNSNNVNEILKYTEDIAKDINEDRAKKGLKPRRLRILILGIPNVGKSTLINRLVGKRATKVGNRPGVTKSLEWIRINKDLELLDTPGILWPKLESDVIALNLASMTAIKEEILNKDDVAIYIINTLMRLYPNVINDRYKIDVNVDTDIVDILDMIGKSCGCIRGGEVDYERVYTIILRDLREGHFGKVTFDIYED